MSSGSLRKWQRDHSADLDRIATAHRAVGGRGPGRRWATQQINQAYAVFLSSHFQAFCRDLHTESIDHIARGASPRALEALLRVELTLGRKLDQGNPNPGNIGSDFNRLGIDFWVEVRGASPRNAARQQALQALADWRNAIAHQDFDPAKLVPPPPLRLSTVRAWRGTCNVLARIFDEVMGRHLGSLLGARPW